MEIEIDWKANRVVVIVRSQDGIEYREAVPFGEAESKFDDIVTELERCRRMEHPETELEDWEMDDWEE